MKNKRWVIKCKNSEQYLNSLLCAGPRFTNDKKKALPFLCSDEAYLTIFHEGLLRHEVIEYEEE